MEKLNDNQPTSISGETTEKGMTRRQVIKTGAAAAGAIALVGGFPYISSAQNKTLNIVRGTYFIPAAQEIAKQQAEEFGKQDAKKYIRFKDLPPVLQISLNRFDYDISRGNMVKSNQGFKFDEVLDLEALLPKE